MSKGHGTTQRALLAALTADWTPVIEVADLLTDPTGGTRATRATVESVRRAAKRLSDDGLVELRRSSLTGYTTGRLLCARLVP